MPHLILLCSFSHNNILHSGRCSRCQSFGIHTRLHSHKAEAGSSLKASVVELSLAQWLWELWELWVAGQVSLNSIDHRPHSGMRTDIHWVLLDKGEYSTHCSYRMDDQLRNEDV